MKFLHQIVLKIDIYFDIYRTYNMPLNYHILSKGPFYIENQKRVNYVKSKRRYTAEIISAEINRDFNI